MSYVDILIRIRRKRRQHLCRGGRGQRGQHSGLLTRSGVLGINQLIWQGLIVSPIFANGFELASHDFVESYLERVQREQARLLYVPASKRSRV